MQPAYHRAQDSACYDEPLRSFTWTVRALRHVFLHARGGDLSESVPEFLRFSTETAVLFVYTLVRNFTFVFRAKRVFDSLSRDSPRLRQTDLASGWCRHGA